MPITETALLFARQHFPSLCQARLADSHKGSHGTVAVIGGASGMSGAVVLAASAALKAGAGKVWAGFNQDGLPLPWLPDQPEIMLDTAQNLLRRTDISAWVLGCGLGLSAAAQGCLKHLWQREDDKPLLIDADALTLLAQADAVAYPPTGRLNILTPHPAEAARLLHTDTARIQADRTHSVQTLAARYQAWVVLKGHHSLVAAPEGAVCWCNPSGNPGLATAGSGDVLSGLIGALLAQQLPVYEAVAGGVWLHGLAAEQLAAAGIGPIGLTAQEIAPMVRHIRNQLVPMSPPANRLPD